MNIPHQLKAPFEDNFFRDYTTIGPEKVITLEKKEKLIEACREKEDSFIIGSLGAGIWEMCWHLRGYDNALMDAAADPEYFEMLADKAENQIVSYINLISGLPVDAIMLGDDWGEQHGVLLGGERWRKLIKPRWAKIIQAIHASGKYAINHCCGSIAEIMPDIIEIGLDVLECVQPEAIGMNPYELKRNFGNRITFWGGLGSQSIIPFGTPEELKGEIRRLRSEMSRGGGYILAPSKHLMPGTPV